MLKYLTIKNYALIKHLEMEPSSHLNVITGETGAGKSIMLGAIGLIMGNRADTKVLWDENEKCVTEGIFDVSAYKLKKLFLAEDIDYDDQVVIRREISPGGKSRAFINDTPVTLDVMKRIGSHLLDIHSQHETLQLGNQLFQLRLIDAYAGNQKIREQYEETWQQYIQSKKKWDDLSRQASQLQQEADYIRFQLDELTKADLEEREQNSLETELNVQEHAEDIKRKLRAALELLSSSEYASRTSLAEAKNHIQSISSLSSDYENLHKRLESVVIELDDIINEAERSEGNIEFDPARAELIKERLSTIYRLQKKHHVNTIRELLVIQNDLQQKYDLATNLDDTLAKAKAELNGIEKDLEKHAAALSQSRKKHTGALCKELVTLLKELGIPDANLLVDQTSIPPSPNGTDRVDILFSANKGIAPRSLEEVASGGEFSRLMFGIKYIMAEKSSMPTIIFDEIDNGVSGEIAIKLGKLMRTMSENHQLIAITHLPQIAAKGTTHYFVYKDNSSKKTVSSIQRLSESQRVEEIAKMIGGATPSKVALEGARELLG
jgi:DNA repair protein RecN (Recombination protein N)